MFRAVIQSVLALQDGRPPHSALTNFYQIYFSFFNFNFCTKYYQQELGKHSGCFPTEMDRVLLPLLIVPLLVRGQYNTGLWSWAGGPGKRSKLTGGQLAKIFASFLILAEENAAVTGSLYSWVTARSDSDRAGEVQKLGFVFYDVFICFSTDNHSAWHCYHGLCSLYHRHLNCYHVHHLDHHLHRHVCHPDHLDDGG